MKMRSSGVVAGGGAGNRGSSQTSTATTMTTTTTTTKAAAASAAASISAAASNGVGGGSNNNSNGSSNGKASTAAAAGAHSHHHAKKKFGKNLNKLVKPAAPPIVDRSSGSSRNGLLLLSAKRAASTGGGGATGASAGGSKAGAAASGAQASTTTTTTGGGLLSSKGGGKASSGAGAGAGKADPATAHPPGVKTKNHLPYEAKAASTHDALLSAVVGAVQAEAHRPPDAWGVASAKAGAAAKDTGAAAAEEPPSADGTAGGNFPDGERRDRRPEQLKRNYEDGNNYDQQQQQRSSSPPPPPEEQAVVIQTSNWDEYGGRGDVPGGGAGRGGGGIPSRRAVLDVGSGGGGGGGEDRQVEYMSRLARERAEKRRSEEDARLREQKERAAQRLRELDEKLGSSGRQRQKDPSASHHSQTPPRSRGLWDPDQAETAKAPAASDGKRPGGKGGRDGSSTAGEPKSPRAAVEQQQPPPEYSGPVIQLSSYEDRDRGEQRGPATAPRMLYDPKSGAMVAVKSRDESANAAGSSSGSGGGRGGGGKKSGGSDRKKGRKDRDRGDGGAVNGRHLKKSDSIGPGILVRDEPSSDYGGKSRKSRRGADEAKSGGRGGDKSARRAVNPSRRLPRTCGVMYRRDDKGACYCADDCDGGDLGYGAHSVPGGRARNPEAYADYVKQHQQGYNKDENSFDDQYNNGRYDDHNYLNEADMDVALYTGFNPAEEEQEMQPEQFEYVKADDKLELVTDDSPTLKPSAREFAPSQAALAAAAAAAAKHANKTSERSVDTSEENNCNDYDDDEEEDEDDEETPLGLGFDPTQDMDFVMQSPSGDDELDIVDSVAISSLTLEPQAFPSSSSVEDSGPRHLFAFGSSGTWGVSKASSEATSDWKLPGVGESSGGLFDSGGIFHGSNDDSADSTSFLNIPSSSSWGGPGNLGLPTSGEGPATSTTGD